MTDIKLLAKNLSNIENEALDKIQSCNNLDRLKQLRSKYFGKDSDISKILSNIKYIRNNEEKKTIGEYSNKIKSNIQSQISDKEAILKNIQIEEEISRNIDISLNKFETNIGSLHPVTQMIDILVETFQYFGFSVVSGPEIETDWFCFQSLNLDINHPARDMQDTFYIEENHILPRTHTSSVQIRTMLNEKPPIRIIAPGKVYRNENQDQRHTFMFYQYEGLIIDKTTNISDLKSILTTALRNIFDNSDIELRLRHSFFPYTEPSFEIDATCMVCLGKGCKVCSNKGWIELLGAGMVHPQVLRNVNIDPNVYQGFAFGGGPERLFMVKNMIDDLRLFYENDLKFLSQFRKI